jgi:hypothetical protein
MEGDNRRVHQQISKNRKNLAKKMKRKKNEKKKCETQLKYYRYTTETNGTCLFWKVYVYIRKWTTK